MTARHRNLAAALVLVTAFFADRAMQAAPLGSGSSRPMVADVAGRLIAKLTVRLQTVVPAVRMTAERRLGTTRVPVLPATAPAATPLVPTLLATLLHLPPPAVFVV